jgi:hypothetical protein
MQVASAGYELTHLGDGTSLGLRIREGLIVDAPLVDVGDERTVRSVEMLCEHCSAPRILIRIRNFTIFLTRLPNGLLGSLIACDRDAPSRGRLKETLDLLLLDASGALDAGC